MKRTLQYLFKGLAILLPIVVTFALLQWLLVTIETWLKPIWTTLLGEFSYFPGLAFISFWVTQIDLSQLFEFSCAAVKKQITILCSSKINDMANT
jgi:uncharacterized membrane protein